MTSFILPLALFSPSPTGQTQPESRGQASLGDEDLNSISQGIAQDKEGYRVCFGSPRGVKKGSTAHVIFRVGDLLQPSNRKMVVHKQLVEQEKLDATFQENIRPLCPGRQLCLYSYPFVGVGCAM